MTSGERPVVDALGKAIVAYPFMIATFMVLVAWEASGRGHRRSGFLAWLIVAVVYLGISATISGFVVIPVLTLEFVAWAWIVRRLPGLERAWPGVLVGTVLLAAPWALAPPEPKWLLPVLVGGGLLAARAVVPSLRPGVFLPGE